MKQFVIFCLIISVFSLIQANDDEVQEVQGIVPFIGNGSVSLQMPFVVSIRRASEELTNVHFGNGHICGGVILSRTHILTAASCIQIRETRVPTDDVLVIAGTRYRYDNAGVERSVVKNISIHPAYTFDPLNNNLAIIELNTTLPEDILMISPIEISNVTVAVGTNCQIFGWGLPLSSSGPRELLAGNITIVENNVCGNLSNRICAGPDFISGCAGDDGGPVVCDNLLFGLIDFTANNYCNSSVPGRHTPYINIADYHEWIMQHLISESPEHDDDDNDSATNMLFSCLMLLSSAVFLKFLN